YDLVTGVQTCALPISLAHHPRELHQPRARRPPDDGVAVAGAGPGGAEDAARAVDREIRRGRRIDGLDLDGDALVARILIEREGRSEERRVGKGGGARE